MHMADRKKCISAKIVPDVRMRRDGIGPAGSISGFYWTHLIIETYGGRGIIRIFRKKHVLMYKKRAVKK